MLLPSSGGTGEDDADRTLYGGMVSPTKGSVVCLEDVMLLFRKLDFLLFVSNSVTLGDLI